MLLSMTGYGRGEVKYKNQKITVEVTSLNHRFIEVSNIKLPTFLKSFEKKVVEETKKNFSRGRFDISFNMDQSLLSPKKDVEVDYKLIKSYIQTLEDLKKRFSLKGEITLQDVLQFPDFFTIKDVSSSSLESLYKAMEKCLLKAFKNLQLSRKKEGDILKTEIKNRILKILRLVDSIEEKAKRRASHYNNKLKEKLKNTKNEGNLDNSRTYEQIALISEKSDVTEEVVRTKIHIKNFLKILQSKGEVGKKLDFYIQEINREINTIGAKTQDCSVTKNVVDIKGESEKIREQLQNVE